MQLMWSKCMWRGTLSILTQMWVCEQCVCAVEIFLHSHTHNTWKALVWIIQCCRRRSGLLSQRNKHTNWRPRAAASRQHFLCLRCPSLSRLISYLLHWSARGVRTRSGQKSLYCRHAHSGIKASIWQKSKAYVCTAGTREKLCLCCAI